MTVEYMPKRGSTVSEETNEQGRKVLTSVATPEQLAALDTKPKKGEIGFDAPVDESKSKTHFPGKKPGIYDCDCGAHFSGKFAEQALTDHMRDNHPPNWTPREQWEAKETLANVQPEVKSTFAEHFTKFFKEVGESLGNAIGEAKFGE